MHHHQQQQQYQQQAPLGWGMPGPIGVSAAYMSQRPTNLVIHEKKTWGDDDYTVQTAEGQPVMRLKHKAFTATSRKHVYAPDGQHLFDMRQHHLKLPPSFYFEDPAGNRFVDLKGIFAFGHNSFDVTFRNAVGGGADVKLELRAVYNDRSADINWNGVTIARVRREVHWLRTRDTYGVEVAPGVDLILIAAVVITMDEVHQDDQPSNHTLLNTLNNEH